MKKHLLSFIIAITCLSGITLNAQDLKFGHVNSQELLVIMPEYKQAIDSLTKVRERFGLTEEQLTVEINRKYNDLMEQQSTLDSLILQIRFSELQDLQNRLQEFQQGASQKLRSLEGALTGKIMDKMEKAVSDVAIELNLIYVFDIAAGNPIYTSDKSINIVPMVKEKLGLQ
jgi:outer membrane protein